MQNHQAFLRCSHTTAGTLLITIGTILTLIGCTNLYKALGLTDEQIAAQLTKDQHATTEILDTGRQYLWQIATATVTGVGALLSGLLARWLGTERKITRALITGIESADDLGAKASVKAKATAAGIEPKLNARVRALT